MKYPNIPRDNPRGENHRKGTIKPAETVERSIWMKACPDDAVPRIFSKRSSAAIDRTGIARDMPTL